jgi:DNA-binding transcriptional ArsR family regulator
MERLSAGVATVNELAKPFPVSVQAVSKHLKVLEGAGLITRGRSGQLRPSRIDGAALKEAAEWIEGYRSFWERGFERMEQRLGG